MAAKKNKPERAPQSTERVLFIPDAHIPYECKESFDLMLRAAKVWKPHTIVILGDFGDFYATSGHRKDPNRNALLESEVEAVNARLDEVGALGAKRVIYVQGNHEENLERYLMDKAPSLFNMIRTEKLFDLKKRGMEYVPYRRSIKVGQLNVTHDTGSAGATAHTKSSQDFGGNAVIGHTHRMSVGYTGNLQGHSHVAAMFGWLGDRKAADYLHDAQKAKYWQLGFGIGHKLPDGVVHLQAIPIVNGSVVLDGKVIN